MFELYAWFVFPFLSPAIVAKSKISIHPSPASEDLELHTFLPTNVKKESERKFSDAGLFHTGNVQRDYRALCGIPLLNSMGG